MSNAAAGSITMQPVTSESGNIVAVGYDPEAQYLVVEFKGGSKYGYKDVPLDEWDALEATIGSSDTSTGAHFSRNIRNVYVTEKL